MEWGGAVIRCPDSRHALVNFREIGQQTVPQRFVIPVSGAISRPPLNLGDCVLAKVRNKDTGLECYVPGVIRMTPLQNSSQLKFYTVVMYTKQTDHFLRSHIIKISKMRHSFVERYIADRAPPHGDDGSGDEQPPTPTGSEKASNHSSEKSRSRSWSRSRSRSKSGSRNGSRNESPASGRYESHEQRTRLERWQRHLARQQRKQEKQQKKLRSQAKKLSKLKQQVKVLSTEGSTEQKQLLTMILEEIKNKKESLHASSRSSRHHGDSPQRHLEESQHTAADQPAGPQQAADSDDEAMPFAMKMRSRLPCLEAGEEVLARWTDDGWYYRGTVRHNCGDGSYLIEDSIGNLEKIWREDAIADRDDANILINVKDAVIASHPNYSHSYAPAVVMGLTSDLYFTLRFYDGAEGSLPHDEVYHLAAEKFETDVSYIVQWENCWVGQAVVARNDDTGTFELGSVQERLESGLKYLVEWSDGSTAAQKATFMFGAFTKRHALSVGDHVIAPSERAHFIYLPGVITGIGDDEIISVRFCDDSATIGIDPVQCFWLSQTYYADLVEFYDDCQRSPPTALRGQHNEETIEGFDRSVRFKDHRAA